MGEHAADPLEGSLYCVRPGDDIIHDLLEVLVGSGGSAVLQDSVRVPAVAEVVLLAGRSCLAIVLSQ